MEALLSEALRESEVTGACQPAQGSCISTVTSAPFGAASVSSFVSESAAVFSSIVGGILSASRAVVSGLKTLPASSGDGAPPSPVTARLAAQVLFKTSSVGSSESGLPSPAKGVHILESSFQNHGCIGSFLASDVWDLLVEEVGQDDAGALILQSGDDLTQQTKT